MVTVVKPRREHRLQLSHRFRSLQRPDANQVTCTPQVEQYIEKQSSPQREIVERLRKTILRTFPDVKEEMKMGVPWYEGKLYVVALKDHVNLGFCLKGLSQKEKGLLEGSGRQGAANSRP